MKLLKYLSLSLCALGLTAAMGACDDDVVYDNPSGETLIYDIKVVNGGLSGSEQCQGTLDGDNISFEIPAETDIEAIRFNGKISLGAHFDQEAYDLSTLQGAITIVNGENAKTYNVTISLKDPVASPVLTSITSVDDQGIEHKGFISEGNHTVYLACPGSTKATVKEIVTLPKRATKTFTADLGGNTVAGDNPGKLVLDFMGLTAEYFVSFGSTPVFGADWAAATVYDHSSAATIWPDFAAENTRWAQFDGEYMLMASRQGGTLPKVISFESVKAGSPEEQTLDCTGIEKGTYLISSCAISHKHFYVCNLTTGMNEAAPLKIYYWSDKDAKCQTVLTCPGTATISGRWGDNMEVDLDQQGNGYIFFINQDPGTTYLRFSVRNFTDIDPTPMLMQCPYKFGYYGAFNRVPDTDNEYVVTSATQQVICLSDRDGNVLNQIDPGSNPTKGETDARIVNFNGERYMITASTFSWAQAMTQRLFVYNLSSGANTVLAFSDFNNSDRTPVFTYDLKGAKCSAFSANTGAGVSPDGTTLRIMACGPKAGFIMVEVPMKQ